MKPKFTSSHHRAGFTLVELLVVVVIIAALASLSFMGVRRAMDSAARTKTIANMKQLVSTTQIFSSDNNGVVLNWNNTVVGGQQRPWSQHLLVALSPELTENNNFSKSIGDNYARSLGIFSDPKALKNAGDELQKTGHNSWRTYAYNNRIGSYTPATGETTPSYVSGPRFAVEVKHPNKLILFAQRTRDGNRFHPFLEPHNGREGKIDFDLYGGSAMVGFYDGHIEMFKKANYPEQGLDNPNTGAKYTSAQHDQYWTGGPPRTN